MKMKIFVDADASPVQKEVIQIAGVYHLPVVLVKSISHFSNDIPPPHVKTIYVDKGADMADFEIVKLATYGDMIITQDYGLASLCLGKGCHVLHHKGFLYTEKNIDRLLQSRHASAMARRGGYKTKGPKAFTKEERDAFCELLHRVIKQHHTP